jgi:hypothetical protein
MKKRWWKSKTIWLNGATGVLVALEQLASVLPPAMAPQLYMGLSVFLPAANFALRLVTDKPIGKDA